MGANADTLRTLYKAFGDGDIGTVLGAMDDEIEWQEPTGGPYQSQVGPQAIAENIFGPATTQIEGFSVTLDEIVDGGDVVAAIGRYGGKGASNGLDLDAEFVQVCRFGPDGKLTNLRTYTDTYLWRLAVGAD
jgi:uncharacterized protein